MFSFPPCHPDWAHAQVLSLRHLIHSIAVMLATVIAAGFCMSQLLCAQPHHLCMVMVMSCTCTVAAVPLAFVFSVSPPCGCVLAGCICMEMCTAVLGWT